MRWTMPTDIAVILYRAAALFATVSMLYGLMMVFSVPFNERHRLLLLVVGLLAALLFRGPLKDDIVTPRRVWPRLASTLTMWLKFGVILLILGYLVGATTGYSRKLLTTWYLLTPLLLVAGQFAVSAFVNRFVSVGKNSRRAVIAGANAVGQRLASKIHEDARSGIRVLGFFDDRRPERLSVDDPGELLGNLQDLPNFTRSAGVDVIFLALPLRNVERVTTLLDELQDTTVSIYFVPDIFVFDLIQCRAGNVGGVPVISLCETPYFGMKGVVKRLSDYIIASLAIVLLSPVFLAIAAGVKLSSPGPVIFRQRRYGLDGREIAIYKFRTMTVREDGDRIPQAKAGDKRVTPFGRFLRSHSLDELPQFLNVLQGRMSVVGPRPHAVAHNEEYRRLIKGYMVRHKVNPGMTGLAQVMGHRGVTLTVDAMARRIEYDLEYLRNWSIGLDMKIIAKTAILILSDKNAL